MFSSLRFSALEFCSSPRSRHVTDGPQLVGDSCIECCWRQASDSRPSLGQEASKTATEGKALRQRFSHRAWSERLALCTAFGGLPLHSIPLKNQADCVSCCCRGIQICDMNHVKATLTTARQALDPLCEPKSLHPVSIDAGARPSFRSSEPFLTGEIGSRAGAALCQHGQQSCKITTSLRPVSLLNA